jgi:hypothetical protein
MKENPCFQSGTEKYLAPDNWKGFKVYPRHCGGPDKALFVAVGR